MAVGSIPPSDKKEPDHVNRVEMFSIRTGQENQERDRYEKLLNKINSMPEAEVLITQQRITERGEWIIGIVYTEPAKKAIAKKKGPD